jgi:hypothetical protein
VYQQLYQAVGVEVAGVEVALVSLCVNKWLNKMFDNHIFFVEFVYKAADKRLNHTHKKQKLIKSTSSRTNSNINY